MPTTPISLPSQAPSTARRAALSERALLGYYVVGTPILFVADFALGANVRVAFLDASPTLRVLYYAVAFGCGLVAMRRPAWAGLVGLVESAANIVLLIFGVMLGYFAAIDAAVNDIPLATEMTGSGTVNLVLSATMCCVSYVRHLSRRQWAVGSRDVRCAIGDLSPRLASSAHCPLPTAHSHFTQNTSPPPAATSDA